MAYRTKVRDKNHASSVSDVTEQPEQKDIDLNMEPQTTEEQRLKTQSVVQKIDDFFSTFPRRHYDTGQIVGFPYENFKHLVYVHQGTVRVYDVTLFGNEVVVNVFKTHSIYPISQVLNGTPNRYFYQAITPIEITYAKPGDFISFLKDNPDVMLELLKENYLNAQKMRRRMAHLMGGTAVNRLIFELINQSRIFGQKRKDGSYFLPISEGELGARSGLSRETVSRLFRDLKTRDILTVGPGGISVIDIEQLENDLGEKL